MFEFRQVLVRLRASDTAREIARSGLLGRDKVAELQKLAGARLARRRQAARIKEAYAFLCQHYVRANGDRVYIFGLVAAPLLLAR